VRDLIGALQSLIDPSDYGRDAVRRIKAFVRIHLADEIRVRCDLPATDVDRFQSRLHLLHRLIAGERAERIDQTVRSDLRGLSGPHLDA